MGWVGIHFDGAHRIVMKSLAQGICTVNLRLSLTFCVLYEIN